MIAASGLLSLLISFLLHDEYKRKQKSPSRRSLTFSAQNMSPLTTTLWFFNLFFLFSNFHLCVLFFWRSSVHYQSLRSAASLFRNASLIFVKVVSVRTKKKKPLLQNWIALSFTGAITDDVLESGLSSKIAFDIWFQRSLSMHQILSWIIYAW